jgi:Flp pilus assembly protein TadD
VPWLALAGLTLVVFAPVARFGFLGFDDDVMVVGNPFVNTGLTGAGLRWAFTTSFQGIWMPLTWLSHQATVAAFGLRPGAHHLVNLALHLGNTLALFALLRGLTGAAVRSAFVAAVFAVHPLHVESVAWVSERKDVLSVFLGLLAALAWVRWARGGRGRWYAAALALFGCALAAKGQLVVLAPVLLLLEWWPLGRLARPGLRVRPLAGLAPFFVLAAGAGLLLVAGQRAAGTMTLDTALGPRAKALHALASTYWYLKATFWPSGLAAYYPYRAGGDPVWQVLAGAALLSAATVGAVALWRRAPAVATGWGWFLGALLPMIGFVQAGDQAWADRYTYFALIGLALALAWGAADLAGDRLRRAFVPAGAAAVLGLAVACAIRLPDWRDTPSLFRRALAVTEGNFFAHNNLGTWYSSRGQFEEAAAQYREAIRAKPGYALAHANLGSVSYTLGRYAEAAANYAEAARFAPADAAARRNLGIALAALGRHDEAIAAYREALRVGGEDAVTLGELGVSQAQRGELAEAVRTLERAARLAPGDAIVRGNLEVARAALTRRGAGGR